LVARILFLGGIPALIISVGRLGPVGTETLVQRQTIGYLFLMGPFGKNILLSFYKPP